MFSLLIDHPDREYTGDQIAECGIPNGAHGVAGVLAWPGRHGSAIGRGLPSEWREDPVEVVGYYWIPADRAEVFKAARERAEGAGLTSGSDKPPPIRKLPLFGPTAGV